MKKYVCDVCGYVYDPAENDNVAFEDLPEDYTCPLCGVGKDQFSEEEQVGGVNVIRFISAYQFK